MAVNEDVSAYSVTAASNTPAGGDTVGPDLDNHLRDMKKNVRQTAEHFISVADENFKGRIKADTSGSTHTLKYFADSQDLSLVAIDDSASSVTPYIDTTLMGAAAKNFNKQTTTASAQTALDLTIGTVGGQLLAETATASARSRLDLGTVATQDVGTGLGNIPQLLSGSATSAPSLPAVFGDRLLGLTAPKIVDRWYTAVATSTTGNTRIPNDDTIPQNDEGDEYITLTTGTLKDAANRLRVTATLNLSSSSGLRIVAALFQDSVADALRTATNQPGTTNEFTMPLIHEFAPGATTAVALKIRAACNSGILTFNGDAGSRLYGGTLISDIIVDEIEP